MRHLVLALALLFPGWARADLRVPDNGRPASLARCREALSKIQVALREGKQNVALVEVADGVELRLAVQDRGAEPFVVARCTIGAIHVPEGTITLPAGWLAVDGQGIDSRVGKIVDARSMERLQYDIGAMAGAYASAKERGEYEWFREETVAGHLLRYGVRKRELRLTIEPFTNFWGPAPTRAQAEALVAILRTLR